MKIALIAHSTLLAGPLHNIETYYLSKGRTVIRITHPLDDYHNRASEVSINSVLRESYPRKSLGLFNYVADAWLTFSLLAKYKPDVIVGCDNFDTFTGLMYKMIAVRWNIMVMYFASDYAPRRFANSLLNTVYLWIEKSVLTSADYTVSNTRRAETERLNMGLLPEKSRVIPNCIMEKPVRRIKKYSTQDFIYIGSLTKEHGLLNFIQQTYGLIKSITIIGDGYEKDALISFLRSKSVPYSFISQVSRRSLRSYLVGFNGFGLAPYTASSPWTRYASPLKVVEYLAFGIPVIMSDIPEISQDISRDGVGIVYNTLSKGALEREIRSFVFEKFSGNAYRFSNKYYFREVYKNLPL